MQSKILGIKPLISVIVPVYNTEKYLSKCLDSILAQTYTNLEIILVDDGSTDNSGAICDDYAKKDNRIKVIHKKNGGISSARNKGIQNAKGELLSFIDSDDWIASNFIEILLSTLQKFKTKIACVSYYFVDSDTPKAVSILNTLIKSQVLTAETALQKGFSNLGFFAWNKLYVKELFKEINFPEGKLFEDMATISKIFLETNKIAVNNTPLYYYNRLNLESTTRKKFSVNKMDYFLFSGKLLTYAQEENRTQLIQIIKQERAYHISGFLRQIIESDFEDKNMISAMQKELRTNIFLLLVSHHKLSNKLFAITCCINFLLAKKIYLLLRGNEK